MKVISIINNKGGVSKSTSTCNIVSCMAELGKKVLCIDLDAQRNLTLMLNINKYSNTIYDCLCGRIVLDKAIIHTDFGFDLIPSNRELSDTDVTLLRKRDKEFILKNIIESANLHYDFIFIDCPPNLNLITTLALTCSSDFIIPLEASILSIFGLNELIKEIKLIQNEYNQSLKNMGVFLAKVDARSSLSKEFNEQLKDIFGQKLFNTMINSNTAIVRSQIAKMPINFYNKSSKPYNQYMNLTKEVLSRGN